MIIKALNNQQGAALVEYALLATIIAVGCIFAVAGLGESVIVLFERVAGAF